MVSVPPGGWGEPSFGDNRPRCGGGLCTLGVGAGHGGMRVRACNHPNPCHALTFLINGPAQFLTLSLPRPLPYPTVNPYSVLGNS